MKKMMFMMMAALMMSMTAVAQDDKQDKKPEKKFDKTEMIKHRTDQTAKKYNLNSDQTAQLLALNTKYADKFGPRGHKPGKGRPPRGMKKSGEQTDANSGATAPQEGKKRPEMTEEQKAKFEAERKAEMEARKAYDAELQKIMTADQFKQYQEDMKKQGDRKPRGKKPGKKD